MDHQRVVWFHHTLVHLLSKTKEESSQDGRSTSWASEPDIDGWRSSCKWSTPRYHRRTLISSPVWIMTCRTFISSPVWIRTRRTYISRPVWIKTVIKLKSRGTTAYNTFLSIIWDDGRMPADLRHATTVKIIEAYPISPCLENPGPHSPLNRITPNVYQNHLPETQCWFRPGRSTIDMVLKIQQKAQLMDLYVVFIDLTTAFDKVNREALWPILKKVGSPRKINSLIRFFHDNMTGKVLSNGDFTNSFNVPNGVKQRCVPTLMLHSTHWKV